MADLRKLNLPTAYEELVNALGGEWIKMMQFVVPVEDAEKELAIITNSMRYSGKIVFLLGDPGIGKSTFIQSLMWRKFLPIPEIKEINAPELGVGNDRFEQLYRNLSQIANQAKIEQRGMITVVINYLEDFSGYAEESVRAFFRDVNGLLRNNPILVIWPVTQKDEALRMLSLASAVSGTVFAERPILEFSGPSQEKFPTIAKSTIATLNEGLSFDDFQLTEEDLGTLLTTLNQKPKRQRTIRDYLNLVKSEWEERSGDIQKMIDKIPRFTEVWFVVCYPDAESTVNQFARKSTESDLAWNADLRKFSEYLTGQKAANWNQRRLIYALQGFFKTKILFMPTNALVSCVAAFGPDKDQAKHGSEAQYVEQALLEKIYEKLPSSRPRLN
jgi:hypothetical protein